MTSSAPSNTSELQLYRVLQRANLLQYYDTFVAQGGDDVQQLCEAGEEEFLEIMALVGMASKPLHVRRLQKALQEWVVNPAMFQQPLVGTGSSSTIPAPGSITASVQRATSMAVGSHGSQSIISAPTWSPAGPSSPPLSVTPPSKEECSQDFEFKSKLTPIYKVNTADINKLDFNTSMSQDINSRLSTSPLPTPILVEHQILALAEASDRLVATLPPFEAKSLNMKKLINKEIEEIMNLPREYDGRMDQIRKYSAIYGRFDSKRKYDKPMSLHEISVNEAAAQLCNHIPALMTRREELFPLARQVVRDSGYQYSKGHSSRATMVGENLLKKSKLDTILQKAGDQAGKSSFEKAQQDVQERINRINQDLHLVSEKQQEIKDAIQVAKVEENYTLIHEYQSELEQLTREQLALLTEQSDIMKRLKKQKCKQLVKGQPTNGDHNMEGDGDSVASGSVSPHFEEEEEANTDYYSTSPKISSKAKQFVQESLFDEGLRIAQQYGMADFAEELIGMKKKTPEEEEEDNCIKSETEIETDNVVNHDPDKNGGAENDDVESSCSESDEANVQTGTPDVKDRQTDCVGSLQSGASFDSTGDTQMVLQ